MITDTFEITADCKLAKVTFEGCEPWIYLEYVENSTDPYFPNNITQIDIDLHLAKDIVKTLESYFGKKIYD